MLLDYYLGRKSKSLVVVWFKVLIKPSHVLRDLGVLCKGLEKKVLAKVAECAKDKGKGLLCVVELSFSGGLEF